MKGLWGGSPKKIRRYFNGFFPNFLPNQKIFLPLHPILAVKLVKTAEIEKVKEPDKVKRYRFDGDKKSKNYRRCFE